MELGSSRIPKSVSKLPQFKRNVENQLSKVPARNRLRRSKSLTDLRTSSNSNEFQPRQRTELTRVLKPITETNVPNKTLKKVNNAPVIKKSRKSQSYTNLSSTSVNTNLRTTSARVGVTTAKRCITSNNLESYATKRVKVGAKTEEKVANNQTKVPDKPKVTKPASYDYKARFNLLNEKHTTLRKHHSELKENNEQNKAELVELTENHKNLEDQLRIAQEKCTDSAKRIEEISNDYERVLKSEKEFAKLNAEYSKRIEELTKCNEEISMRNDDLLKRHKALSICNQELRTQNETSNSDLQKTLEKLACCELRIQDLEDTRRCLHNTVQDLKGNIRVFCRVRPQLEMESDRMSCNIDYTDECTVEVRKSKESISSHTIPGDLRLQFSFDRVFAPSTTQSDIFEDLAHLIQSALDGYHVCVFAYGQTGSGKTYTMHGEPTPLELGMIPRSMDLLFHHIGKLEIAGWEYTVQVSFLEIYNEVIRDLLDSQPKRHEIRYNEGRGITVTNLNIQPIHSAESFKQLMMEAHRNRAVAATSFNQHSSRSHAVTKIYLEGVNKITKIKYIGSINLVDLAGSESAKTSCAERLVETRNINKSLSALGSVILALLKKEDHVPYRNSKLTYLLQSCLGGNSKTLMVVNISPLEECYNETINSLRFAAKVKDVKMSSKRNKTYEVA